MSIPTFTLTGELSTLTGNTETPLAGVVLTFTSNVLRGDMLRVDNASQLIAPKPVTLDSDGKINGTAGIQLLANDESLGLSTPLQWTVSASNLPAGQKIRKFTFEAPPALQTIDLKDVTYVVGATAQGDAKGDKGDQGVRGPTGVQGPPGTFDTLDGGTPASVGAGSSFDGGIPESIGIGAAFDGGIVGVNPIDKPAALITVSQLEASAQAAIGLAKSAVQPQLLGVPTAPFSNLDTRNDARYEPLEQFAILPSTYTLTTQTAAQKLLNTTTNGAITLPVGEYAFECGFALTSMSASSGSFGFGFAGGAGPATFTQSWLALVSKSAAGLVGGATVSSWATVPQTTLIAVNTNTAGAALIKGFVKVTAAGTVIPQVSLTVAAPAVVAAGSFFRIQSVNSTAAYSGAWS